MNELREFMSDWEGYQAYKLKKLNRGARDVSHVREIHKIAAQRTTKRKQNVL
jgi:hypothetical protein